MKNKTELDVLLPAIVNALDEAIRCLALPKIRDEPLMEAIALILMSTARATGPSATVRRWWAYDYDAFDRAIDLFTNLYGEIRTQEIR